MLNITITATKLVFNDLTDELYQAVNDLYPLETDGADYFIEDDPKTLYKILLKLSYDYDIELN